MKKSNITQIILVGVMAALVFVFSHLWIPLPAEARIHFGNIMCLLAGIVLGPVMGGLAAGIGSALFDLTSLYITSTPFTLVFKFLMGFVCGAIAWRKGAKGKNVSLNIIGGIAGILTYIVLYLGKNFITDYFFLQVALQTAFISMATRGLASLINGIIAVAASVPLSIPVKKAVDHMRQKGI